MNFYVNKNNRVAKGPSINDNQGKNVTDWDRGRQKIEKNYSFMDDPKIVAEDLMIKMIFTAEVIKL